MTAPTRPVVLFPRSVADPQRILTPGSVGVSVEDLLAEPRFLAPEWFRAAYTRVLVGGGLPSYVAGAFEREPGAPMVGPEIDVRLIARLEAAGVPTFAMRADPDRIAALFPAAAACVAAGAVGSRRPALVVVGDREPVHRGLPFFAKSGAWLLRALRALGHDELTLLLLNAYDEHDRPNERVPALVRALAPYAPAWVAVGEQASAVLARGLKDGFVRVPHPAWHLRFHYGKGHAGYADLLAEAGVPRVGLAEPLAGTELPCPTLSPPYDLPSSHVYKPKPRLERWGGVAHEKAERARVAFVTRDAATLAEAAALVGVPRAKLAVLAHAADWEHERDEQDRRVREAKLERAAEAEARAFTEARKLAIAGTNLALARVVQRIQGNQLEPSVRDAHTLASTWALLAPHAAPGADAKVDRLRAMPLPELVAELNRTLLEQFGPLPGVVEAPATAARDVTREAAPDHAGALAPTPLTPSPTPSSPASPSPSPSSVGFAGFR